MISQSRPKAPFVVGASRSGTTMLRLMLDGHPAMAIPPETHFVPRVGERCEGGDDPVSVALDTIIGADRWPSFGLDAQELRALANERKCRSPSDVLRLFYERYADSRGKTRWGDKTPWYVLTMPTIAGLLEEAHFLQIIRDGRDVALSVIPLWFGPTSVREAAEWWVQRVRRGRRDGTRVPYLEVLYERLVEQPETELRRICAFIGLDFDTQMLSFDRRVREEPEAVAPHLLDLSLTAALAVEPVASGEPRQALISPQEMQRRLALRLSGPPDTTSVRRWRTEMTGAELETFERIAGSLLDELGYPRA